MGTPHNEAAKGAFAKTVLMPGDPLRAKFIAETFLEDAKLVNNVRGIQGYTGSYKGTPVSVMASGMGMPSIVVMGQGACTDSNYAHQFGMSGTFAPIADFKLLETAVAVARRLGVEPPVGNLLSSDIFYNKTYNSLDWGKMGVLAVEMESAALYCNAAEAGKRALTICTISDSLVTGEELPPADRQTSFTQMMEIALETAVEMAR